MLRNDYIKDPKSAQASAESGLAVHRQGRKNKTETLIREYLEFTER